MAYVALAIVALAFAGEREALSILGVCILIFAGYRSLTERKS